MILPGITCRLYGIINKYKKYLLVVTFYCGALNADISNYELRLNQLGFYPDQQKTATLMVDAPLDEVLGGGEFRYVVVGENSGSSNTTYLESPWQEANAFRDYYMGGYQTQGNGRAEYPDTEWKAALDKWVYNIVFTEVKVERDSLRVEIHRRDDEDDDSWEVLFASPLFSIGSSTTSQKYRDMANSAFKYFYYHRLGEDILPEFLLDISPFSSEAENFADVHSHAAFHGGAVPCYLDWCGNGVMGEEDEIMLGAGTAWADAGDFGVYPVNHAFAAWQLLNLVEFPADSSMINAQIPEPNTGELSGWFDREVDGEIQRFRIASEVEVGAQFMLDIFDHVNGLAPHKFHNQSWGEGMGAWSQDEEINVGPATNPSHGGGSANYAQRSATVPSTASTLAICRTSAHLARIMFNFDKQERANIWLQNARTALERAQAEPGILYPEFYANEDPLRISIGGGPYDDADISDDLYACYVELYLAAVADPVPGPLEQQLEMVIESNPYFIDTEFDRDFGWQNVATAANLSLLVVENGLSPNGIEALKLRLAEVALGGSQTTLNTTTSSASDLEVPLFANFQHPYDGQCGGSVTPEWCNNFFKWQWGSNAELLNRGVLMVHALEYGDFTFRWDGFYEDEDRATIQDAALGTLDYILGENGINMSFVTGFGEFSETDTHDRNAWNALTDDEVPFPKGWLSGGPLSVWETCLSGNEAKHEEGLPNQQGSAIDNLRPWETGTPFFIETINNAAWTLDELWEADIDFLLSPFDQAATVAFYSNMVLNGEAPVLDGNRPQGPFVVAPPATIYGAPGTADNAWCSKENTINYNSALLWMTTAAASYLPKAIHGDFELPFELFEESTLVSDSVTPENLMERAVITMYRQTDSSYMELVSQDEEIHDGTQWLIGNGNYVIRAVVDGCHAPGDPSTSYVQTELISFPEDDLVFNLVMTCNEDSGGIEEPDTLVDWSFNQNGGSLPFNYCGELVITNVSNEPITSWQVELPVEGQIYVAWNMLYETSQGLTTFRSTGEAWSSHLVPGQSTHSLGFCANL